MEHAVSRENEVLRAILEATRCAGPEQALERVVVGLSRAMGTEVVYLALGPHLHAPTWSCARGLAGEAMSDVRGRISRGVMARALEAGEPFVTAAAVDDARLSDQSSVRRLDLQSVLCVALPGETITGVLYLQHPQHERTFDQVDVDLVVLAAEHIRPMVEQVLTRLPSESDDPTARMRARLSNHTGIVGRSRVLAQVLEMVAVAAGNTLSVLLTGPSGSGKSHLAQAIHDNASRRGRFVAVNCSTLLGDRLVAELFGAARGAYTGQHGERQGLVQAAARGTLFLDEVGTLPLDAQAQLLQFLQDGTFQRLGDPHTHRANDVRIIAATNEDLGRAVAEGRFRQDLLFRLQQWPIEVPPLDARREDIPVLAQALLARHAHSQGLVDLPLSAEALLWLQARGWPGGVRELDQVLLRAAAWARFDDSRAIRLVHLDRSHAPPAPDTPEDDLERATHQFRVQMARRVLDAVNDNKSEAARRLGISRSSLYALLESSAV